MTAAFLVSGVSTATMRALNYSQELERLVRPKKGRFRSRRLSTLLTSLGDSYSQVFTRLYEQDKPHEVSNIIRVVLVAKPGTKADQKAIALLEEVLGGIAPERDRVFGFAIPLSERHVFIGVPATVDADQMEVWSMNGAGLVSNYSVGHRSRRVVVHPSAVSSLPEGEIVEAIRGAREGVVRAMELCQDLSAVVRRMDAVFSG